MTKTKTRAPLLTRREKSVATRDGVIAAIKLLRARTEISLRDAVAIVRVYLARKQPIASSADLRRVKALAGKEPEWVKNVNPKAFASHDAGGGQETMIHVYWSALGDARDVREGGHGHRMQRDRVSASLGLDAAPDPGFTPDEMQTITRAAKMAALKCLRERSRLGR